MLNLRLLKKRYWKGTDCVWVCRSDDWIDVFGGFLSIQFVCDLFTVMYVSFPLSTQCQIMCADLCTPNGIPRVQRPLYRRQKRVSDLCADDIPRSRLSNWVRLLQWNRGMNHRSKGLVRCREEGLCHSNVSTLEKSSLIQFHSAQLRMVGTAIKVESLTDKPEGARTPPIENGRMGVKLLSLVTFLLCWALCSVSNVHGQFSSSKSGFKNQSSAHDFRGSTDPPWSRKCPRLLFFQTFVVFIIFSTNQKAISSVKVSFQLTVCWGLTKLAGSCPAHWPWVTSPLCWDVQYLRILRQLGSLRNVSISLATTTPRGNPVECKFTKWKVVLVLLLKTPHLSKLHSNVKVIKFQTLLGKTEQQFWARMAFWTTIWQNPWGTNVRFLLTKPKDCFAECELVIILLHFTRRPRQLWKKVYPCGTLIEENHKYWKFCESVECPSTPTLPRCAPDCTIYGISLYTGLNGCNLLRISNQTLSTSITTFNLSLFLRPLIPRSPPV